MTDFWRILELEPTTDVRLIKQAYAVLAKKYHPEEYPEEFLKLRKAYEAALQYVSSGNATKTETPPKTYTPPEDLEPTQKQDTETLYTFELSETKQPNHWDFSRLTERKEVNDQAACAQFEDLYYGKKSKDAKEWYLYFTSDDFLAVWKEEKFTKHLLDIAYKNANKLTPNKTFAKCLNAVYGCYINAIYPNEARQFEQPERLDGFSHIEKLLCIHEQPQKLAAIRGNDYAMYLSFCEYRALLVFCEENQWDDYAKNKVEHILDRYDMSYLKERCERKDYNETERNPLALRLILHCIKNYDLPEDIYHYIWQRYSLESAVHGRSSLYYGAIREYLIQKNINQKTEKYNFREAYQKYYVYQKSFQKGACDMQAIKDFFALKNTEYLLQDRNFLDVTLGYWLVQEQHISFLDQLYDFYAKHSTLAQSEKILSRISQRRAELCRENERKQDEQNKNALKWISILHRPFIRYWLNIGFHRAYDFAEILPSCLPFSEKWAIAFAKNQPQWTGFTYKKKPVTIQFHCRYAEYFWGEQPMYQPFLQWYSIENLQDDTAFFLLLPVVFPFIDHKEIYIEVFSNIKARLQHTTLSDEVQNQFADGMIQMLLCGNLLIQEIGAETERKSFDCNALEIYAENDKALYICEWSRFYQTLYFYEQKEYDRNIVQGGIYDNVLTQENAISLAKQLFDTKIGKSVADISHLKIFPACLYVHPKQGKPYSIEKESLTKEDIEDALYNFAENQLQRIEFKWHFSEVVLLCEEEKYVCMYFHDQRYQMNTLLFNPEAYCTVDSECVKYVPFVFGAMPEYTIFPNPKTLIRKFCSILFQFGTNELPHHFLDGEYVWTYNVYLYGKYDAYIVDKIKYGMFPPERVITDANIRRKFLIPKFPVFMEQVNQKGERLQTKITPHVKHQVQTTLQMYLQNNIQNLHLCWQIQADNDTYDTHIFLLQENRQYALFYLNDKTKSAYCLNSSLSEDWKPEGQSPITEFCGIPMHTFQIHNDLIRLRYFLVLLLDRIEQPDNVLHLAGEFTNGTKVSQKCMTYEELYQKLTHTEMHHINTK